MGAVSFLFCQGIIACLHYVLLTGQKYDFKEELSFYGLYHQDPVNQAIHFVFIPTILWSAMVLLAYYDIFGVKLSLLGHRITWATTTYLIYTVYYNILDPFGGRVYSVALLFMYLSASIWVNNELKRNLTKKGPSAKPSSSGTSAWKIALFLQVFSWYMQIHPGHGIYEGVKPALFDSIAQAFSVAPLFAFYEGIWYAGYKTDLQHMVVNSVAAQRQAMCNLDNSYAFCS